MDFSVVLWRQDDQLMKGRRERYDYCRRRWIDELGDDERFIDWGPANLQEIDVVRLKRSKKALAFPRLLALVAAGFTHSRKWTIFSHADVEPVSAWGDGKGHEVLDSWVRDASVVTFQGQRPRRVPAGFSTSKPLCFALREEVLLSVQGWLGDLVYGGYGWEVIFQTFVRAMYKVQVLPGTWGLHEPHPIDKKVMALAEKCGPLNEKVAKRLAAGGGVLA